MKQTVVPNENITHLVSNAFAIAQAHGYDDSTRWVVYVNHNGDVTIRHEVEELVAIEPPVEF